MNKIMLLGRTTSAIELKQTAGGKSVASFTLAVRRPFTKDTTDFINIVVWDKQAETASRYVNKGDMIVVEGYLTNRSYEAQDGTKRYVTEVVAEKVHFTGKSDMQTTVTSMPTAKPAPKFEDVPPDTDLPF